MNAERLHAITQAVLNDLKTTKTVSTLEQLVGALQNQVSQPQTAQYQQQVSEKLQALEAQLSDAPCNDFSPTWKQALQELGLYELLGERLLIRIKEIFERNQITASIAFEELQQLHAQLKGYSEALDKLVSGFTKLQVGTEELNPGQCEIGVLVPRFNVHNKLDELAKDLKDMDNMFGVFAELTTSERPGFEIRSISTSDFSVFLAAVPIVATTIVLAVDRIVNTYKNILEIRIRHEELMKLGMTKRELKTIQEHADTLMKAEIDKIAVELLEKYYKSQDASRRNELEQDLRRCLSRIAKRIDRGDSFEVRAEPPSENDANAQKVNPEDIERIKTILSIAKNIEFFKLTGEPILSLPEYKDAPEKKSEK